MAVVIPFPIFRRQGFIARHAARAVDLPMCTAEKHIRHTLKVQAETMSRRGIDPELIAAEIEAAELAIRATMVRLTLQPGGVA